MWHNWMYANVSPFLQSNMANSEIIRLVLYCRAQGRDRWDWFQTRTLVNDCRTRWRWTVLCQNFLSGRVRLSKRTTHLFHLIVRHTDSSLGMSWCPVISMSHPQTDAFPLYNTQNQKKGSLGLLWMVNYFLKKDRKGSTKSYRVHVG